jgi:hypothetical protein
VRAVLGDISIQGHVLALVTVLESAAWRWIWASLNLSILTFHDLNLAPDTPDDELWRLCQREQIILITANRNADAPNSLETTIRNESTPHSLPVFTIASADHVLHSGAYAERVVEKLLEYLLDIDNFRGTGRLYLP